VGFLKEIGRFFSETSSSPEDKVNELSSSVVSVCKREVPKAQQLERLKTVARKHWTVQARFDLMHSLLRHSEREDSTDEQICTYIVAVGDKILALLGEDPSSGRHRTREDNERMRRSCELQRECVNLANIDKENLRDALWQTFGIKLAWKIFNDPRWEQCCITDLEVWAKDEWNKANPMPENFRKDQEI